MKAKKYKSLRGLFRSAKRWTQETLARDERGEPVPVECPKAASWCLLGAANLVYRDAGSREAAFSKLHRASNRDLIAGFNDPPFTTIDAIRPLVRKAGV